MAVKPQPGPPLSVVRIPLTWTLPPAHAALLVRDDPFPVALVGRWAGGGAIIASSPIRVAAEDDDPFELLDEQPVVEVDDGTVEVDDGTVEAGRAAISPPVGGGWFGWLGYALGRRLERIDPSPASTERLAPFHLAFYDHVLHLDARGQWWFEALSCADRAEAHRKRLDELRFRARRSRRPKPFATDPWVMTPTTDGHALAVAACRERIRAGDLFQANICARLESRLSAGEAIDLFAAAVGHLSPDRAAFVGSPTGAVASLSPELFLERRGRRVRSAPIKGTRAKPVDPARAEHARKELLHSAKDRAENVMIVDLVRNDLGRVCAPGTIGVDALADARPHAGVWHLVSEVRGKTRDGVANADIVRAAFPPGSVSGAPKIAAMNVVAELESSPRGLYTGAVGFASPLAGLELSVAIRTFEFQNDRVWLGVGGGIVADSNPAAEAAECLVKAAPLLDAIGATFAVTPPSRSAIQPPLPLRLAPRPVPRPEPRLGVFETLLAVDGHAVDLEAHLRRLQTSLTALYSASVPDELEPEIIAAAWHLESGRLRVDVRPGANGIEFEVAVGPVPDRTSPLRLCPVTAPGGLGGHKWADRRLLTALGDAVADEPLLCDLDGLVLEAGRANVFAVEPGPCLVTPPADGRILPGVTRARVIELALELGFEVREEPVGLARLARADELFVTGSLAGIEPAVLNDLQPVGPAPVSRCLSEAWRAWLDSTPGSRVTRPGAAPLPA